MLKAWISGPGFVPVDFGALRRHRRPNDHLLAPDGLTPDKPDGAAPTYPEAPEALLRRFTAAIEALARVERVATSEDGLQRDWIVRSKRMGFPDSVTARALTVEDGSTLALWSRAHLGISDRGVNRARAEALLAGL